VSATDLRAPAPPVPDEAAGDTASRSLTWIVGPGLVLGVLSALYGLGRTSLWLDEAYSLGAMHQMGRTLRETSGTMGGYYVTLRAWTTVSESTWWMRSLSVVAAGAALVVVGRVAQRLQGARTARLTVALTALSYLWLVYAREARSYAMVMLLTALAWLALDHALAAEDEAGRRRWWLAHSVLATVLPLFHGLSALQVLPHTAVVAAAGGDRRTWTRLGRGLVGSLAVTGALLSVGAGKVGDWVSPLSIDRVWTAVGLLTNPIPLFTVACVGLLAWGAVGQARTARAARGLDRARTVAPVVWALAPLVLLIALSVVRPSLVPRYLIGSTPGLALLMATGIERIARPDLRRLAVAGLVAVLATGHVDVHSPTDDGWTRATTVVASEARPGDGLLLVAEEDRPPFEAEWRDRPAPPELVLVGSDRPLGTVLRFEDDDLGAAGRRDRAAVTERIWVVGDSVFGTFDDTITDLLGTHREVERWAVRDVPVEVVLLERR